MRIDMIYSMLICSEGVFQWVCIYVFLKFVCYFELIVEVMEGWGEKKN